MKAKAPQHLGFLDLATAPDSPGLYAWYGALSLSPADYRDEVVDGVNLGPRRLRQSLARHTTRFDPRPRRLSARSEFGGRWRGELHDTGRAAIRRLLLGPSVSDEGIEEALGAATSSELLRRELVSILQSAQPYLTAPLYIGVTNSLRRRLREHADLYNELRDAVAGEPERLMNIKRATENTRTEFAHRAVAAEFEPENLSVYVWPYASSLSANDVDRLLRSAEWLLNRWHRPVLGRE
jgi:hypothetical protein